MKYNNGCVFYTFLAGCEAWRWLYDGHPITRKVQVVLMGPYGVLICLKPLAETSDLLAYF
jgi:hypothetical protein